MNNAIIIFAIAILIYFSPVMLEDGDCQVLSAFVSNMCLNF
jgi:hypothetical protein